MKKAVVKIKMKNKSKTGQKKWWDKECRESKKNLNTVLRLRIQDKMEQEKFNEERKRHKKLCKQKEEEYREKEQERIMEITNQTEIWKYIKRERGGREKMGEEIELEAWRKHFMDLWRGKSNIKTRVKSAGQRGRSKSKMERI